MRVVDHCRNYGGIGVILYVLLVLLMGVGAPAQEAPKRVLLIFDEDRTLPGLAILDRTIRSALSSGLESEIEFFAESMNLSQFTDVHYEQLLQQHYAKKYRTGSWISSSP